MKPPGTSGVLWRSSSSDNFRHRPKTAARSMLLDYTSVHDGDFSSTVDIHSLVGQQSAYPPGGSDFLRSGSTGDGFKTRSSRPSSCPASLRPSSNTITVFRPEFLPKPLPQFGWGKTKSRKSTLKSRSQSANQLLHRESRNVTLESSKNVTLARNRRISSAVSTTSSQFGGPSQRGSMLTQRTRSTTKTTQASQSKESDMCLTIAAAGGKTKKVTVSTSATLEDLQILLESEVGIDRSLQQVRLHGKELNMPHVRLDLQGASHNNKLHVSAKTFQVQVYLPVGKKHKLMKVTSTTTFGDLKSRIEANFGIPAQQLRISYLDTTDIEDQRSLHDLSVVPNSMLVCTVWDEFHDILIAASKWETTHVMWLLQKALDSQGRICLADELQAVWHHQVDLYGTTLGWSTLYYAAFVGDCETVEALINFGEKVGAPAPPQGTGISTNNDTTNRLINTSRTPIHAAASMGRTACLRIMLKTGTSAQHVDASGYTAEAWAKRYRNFQSADILARHRWNVKYGQVKRSIK